MSDNYDRYHVFAKAFEERIGEDTLAIIRRNCLTQQDLSDRNGFVNNKLTRLGDTNMSFLLQLERTTAKLNEPWKPLQDNGDGPAARIVDDYNYKAHTDHLHGICQKLKDECARLEAELEINEAECERSMAELRDYWAHIHTL